MPRASTVLVLLTTSAQGFQCGVRPSLLSAHTRAPACTADASWHELLNQPPIIIERTEVLDPGKGILSPPTGVTLTPSGYLGLAIILVQQLFAPWGYVQYSKRLKEDEQAWLELGKSPEQAVTNAYQNVRPPSVDATDAAPSESSSGGVESSSGSGGGSSSSGENEPRQSK